MTTFAINALVFAQIDQPHKPSADVKRTSLIDLRHALALAAPCRTVQQRIQFLTETSLLLLSGPSGDCYRSVNEIALNVISTDGHVLARKPWPSTDPGIVIDEGRLVLARPAGLEVDDRSLNAIQSVELPPHRFTPSMQRSEPQGTVTVSIDGKNYTYGGTPLSLLNREQSSQRETSKRLFTFTNGQTITQDGEVLNLVDDGGAPTKIASLHWVLPPCGRYTYCQAYDASASIQVSTGKKQRVLVYSNGSKFPITDAAGLFPYFRLQVRNRPNSRKARSLAPDASTNRPAPLADNGAMAYIPVGLIHQSALQEMIDKAKSVLGPEVSHVAYRIGEDDTGAPSIFFRITLQDFAMTETAITDSTGRVITALFDQVRPLENWGLRPYFNFRSVSAQQKHPNPDWV